MKTMMWRGIVIASGMLGLFACGLDNAPSSDEPAVDRADSAVGSSQGEADELAAQIAKSKLAANPEAAAAPRNAACGKAGPNIENRRVNDAASPNTALQRSGSSTSCVATGQLNPTDDAIYFCYTTGNDGFTWTYLQRVGGNKGWVRDNLLRDNGSSFWCGF